MNKTIQDYYQTEIQLLHESLASFSTTHPAQAAQMNLDSTHDRDPHVERLLEGSAYLTARIQQQIDVGVHQISEALLRQQAPHYLRPYPSMTMIQYVSPDNRLTRTQSIPSGVKLSSPPLGPEQAVCEFLTTHPLLVYPLRLMGVKNTSASHESAHLEFSFQLHDGFSMFPLALMDLPIYIHALPSIATDLYHCFTKKVGRIGIQYTDEDIQWLGGQALATGMDFNDQTAFVPEGMRPTESFELLSDYFHFPEKYALIQLKFPSVLISKRFFNVHITFSDPLSDIRIHSDLFKLHCVPARNLFMASCEPVRYIKNKTDYPLVIEQEYPQSKQFFAIESITGLKQDAMESVTLLDFNDMIMVNPTACYYRLSHVMEKQDSASSRLRFSGAVDDGMSMSCNAWAFNGHYPRQYMRPNALRLHDERVSGPIQATNITTPSRAYYPLFSSQYALRVVSLVTADFTAFNELAFLKQCLHTHDWSGQGFERIEGIQQIQMTPFNRVSRGMIVRGLTVQLTVKDGAFESDAALYVFGTVLHQLFHDLAPMNTLI